MYNQGFFSPLEDLAAAAEAEEWRGWERSPAHRELYDMMLSQAQVEDALVQYKLSAKTAAKVAGIVCTLPGGNVRIFQTHTSVDKHGEATRIRYDFATCTGGFSEGRFDSWWESAEKSGDGKMDSGELRRMLGRLQVDEGDLSGAVEGVPQWLKKLSVFALLFLGLDGDAKGGVSRDELEALYKGERIEPLEREISFGSIMAMSFTNLVGSTAHRAFNRV